MDETRIHGDYKVPDQNLPSLEERVKRLNKRAVKLGLAPIVITELGAEHEMVRRNRPMCVSGPFSFGEPCKKGAPCCWYEQRFVNIALDGVTPKIAGWRLIAVLDAKAEGVNLLRPVPGEAVPEHYWKAGPVCEHCRTKRYRRETVVVGHDDGSYKQVGKTCLKDFLGGVDPHALADIAELLRSLDDCCGGDGEFDGYGGGNAPRFLTAYSVLMQAAVAIRLHGWAPAKSSCQTTRDRVALWFVPQKWKGKLDVGELEAPGDGDKLLAFETLQWVNALQARSDYEHNLRAVLACGEVRFEKELGIAVSAVSAYQRYLGKQVEYAKRNERKADLGNGWLGTVGKRETFDFEVLDCRTREGDFGVTTIIKFVDDANNLATWFASGYHDLRPGQRYSVKATVKRHGEFAGKPETYLTRAAYTAAKG